MRKSLLIQLALILCWGPSHSLSAEEERVRLSYISGPSLPNYGGSATATVGIESFADVWELARVTYHAWSLSGTPLFSETQIVPISGGESEQAIFSFTPPSGTVALDAWAEVSTPFYNHSELSDFGYARVTSSGLATIVPAGLPTASFTPPNVAATVEMPVRNIGTISLPLPYIEFYLSRYGTGEFSRFGSTIGTIGAGNYLSLYATYASGLREGANFVGLRVNGFDLGGGWVNADSGSSGFPSFQQSSASLGLVSMKAVNTAVTKIARYDHSWVDSGAGYVTASPNIGSNWSRAGYSEEAPELVFPVNFVKTGVHYVWVRAYHKHAEVDSVNGGTWYGRSDSLHIGLNGAETPGGRNITGFADSVWSWRRGIVSIPARGYHEINVWAREDGIRVDKVVVTSSSSYTPASTGPAESALIEVTSMPFGPPEDVPKYIQANNSSGVVSIEVENPVNTTIARGRHAWQPVTAPSGYSGSGALKATPDTGVNWKEDGYAERAPEAQFAVYFYKTGTHYVWIRAHHVGTVRDWINNTWWHGTSDSVHVGLNGQELASSKGITGFTSDQWSWRGGVGVATIHVPSVGTHIVNLWPREDGIVVDKIVLTTSSSYNPNNYQSGKGPNESAISFDFAALPASVGVGTGHDSDGDGMPDWWEIEHGFDPNNAADKSLDPDLDGIPNYEEFLLGTDPHTRSISYTIFHP